MAVKLVERKRVELLSLGLKDQYFTVKLALNWRKWKDSNLHNLSVANLANSCVYRFATLP